MDAEIVDGDRSGSRVAPDAAEPDLLGDRSGSRVAPDAAEPDWSGLGALNARMGITIEEAAPERVVGSMPVDGNTQPYGLLHGGASCVLAETLGSVGAAMYAYRLMGGRAVGVDINATHHRAVRDGVVTGVATPLRLGRTVVSYEVVISNGGGERVCTARLTCVLLRS